MNIKDKDFKFDWSFEDFDDETVIDATRFRKCNHCDIKYNVGHNWDSFRNDWGIIYFGTYKLSCLLCDNCTNQYFAILAALSEIKINNDTTWFVPNRDWFNKRYNFDIDFSWYERLRLLQTGPNNPKYQNHYSDFGEYKSPQKKPIQMSWFDEMEY